MKRFLIIISMSALLSGCAAFQSATIGDDLYTSHNRTEIATRQKAAAEAARAEAEARQAAWEAKLAEAKALAAEKELLGVQSLASTATTNPYDAVLADDYQSAYARRLYGFASPSYKMPSSYYTYRYTDAYQYATAYDPAFYNIMVSGDQVWVEPKYITSMFGSWGASVVIPTYSWYYGWTRPSYSWWYGYPRMSWYDWNWSFGYDPFWYWGFGWGGYPYHPGFIPPHHHHHYYPPHYGGGHKPHRPSIAHRPSYGNSRPGSRPSYLSGYNPNTPQQGIGSGRNNYRGTSGTVTGSGEYRGSSNRSGSQYRNGTTTRNNSSYNQRNDNSYRGSSSVGSYSGGYSRGGISSGGTHGGGQSRR